MRAVFIVIYVPNHKNLADPSKNTACDGPLLGDYRVIIV